MRLLISLGVSLYWSISSLKTIFLTYLILDPDTKYSPYFMIFSTFGCFNENVPKIRAHISSFLLSKNTGFSMIASTSLLHTFGHLSAILASLFSCSYCSLVACWVIGTEKRCLKPVVSVSVFMCMTSSSCSSFMNLSSGAAHPWPRVWRYSACSTSISIYLSELNS